MNSSCHILLEEIILLAILFTAAIRTDGYSSPSVRGLVTSLTGHKPSSLNDRFQHYTLEDYLKEYKKELADRHVGESSPFASIDWLFHFCRTSSSKNPFQSSFANEMIHTSKLIDFYWVPKDVQMFSHFLHKRTNCSDISSQLSKNTLKMDERMKPVWLHKSNRIGPCPTVFVVRDLGEDRIPREVIEAKCSCEGNICARGGHECLPISKLIPVWIQKQPGIFTLDLEEVAFACACIKRPGDFSDSIELMSIHE